MAGEEDIILRTSKQLYAGIKQAQLPQEDVTKVANYLNVVDINKNLRSIPVTDAAKEFKKLDEDVQTIIKQWDPAAPFIEQEKEGFFSRVFKPVGTGLQTYSSKLSEPYRAFRVRQTQNVSWDQAWKLAKNGNALFDKERERKVDNFYKPGVAKVAKLAATGKTIGEIAAFLDTTNVEEIEAFQKLLNSDEEVRKAIADYDTAKISVGRDAFYNIFDVDPGEFGANRKGFNILSGVTDLAQQIVSDPITYIPIFGQAYKISQLSITNIAKQAAKAGATAGAREQAFAKGIDNAFDHWLYGKAVTKYFDELGASVEKFATSKGVAKQEAFSEIRRKFGKDFNQQTIKEFTDNKVFNASAAKKFLADQQRAEGLLRGRATRSIPVLPTYTVITRAKNAIKDTFVKTTGLATRKATPAFDLQGEGLDILFSGGKNAAEDPRIRQVLDAVKQTSGRLDKISRFGEISPSIKSLQVSRIVEKVGEKNGKAIYKTVDKGLESTDAVYAIARAANFSKPFADEIALRWNRATEGERFNIRDGLVIALADAIGYKSTKAGADDFSKALNFLKPEQYAANRTIQWSDYLKFSKQDQKALKPFITKPGDPIEFNPATFGDGVNKAVNESQLARQVSIPDIREWTKLSYSNKTWFFRSMGTFFNGKISEGLVNAWAFLTLVPRLGYRSVLEEVMMFGLTAPLKAIQEYITKGFKLSVITRVVQNSRGGFFDPKGLGLFNRIWFNVLFRGKTEDIVKRASTAKNVDEIADLVAELMLNSKIFPKSKNRIQDAEDVKDWVKYGWGRSVWADVTLGGSFGARNVPLAQKAIGSSREIARIHGDVAPFFADKEAAKRNFKRQQKFEELVYSNTDAYYFSLNNEIVRRVEFGGRTGRIALENIENPTKAISQIAKFLRNNPIVRQRFANAYSAGQVDANKLAHSIYWSIREPFEDRIGRVNMDLVKLVRKPGKKKGTYEFDSEIDFDTLRSFKEEQLPRNILSEQYVETFQDAGSFIKKAVDDLYGLMDRQITTLGREPISFANYLFYRNEIRGLETLRRSQLMKNGIAEEEATQLARRWASEQATDMGVKRTLDFVDNPLVRTNLAFTMRNFARFYRATEDFYRRAYRATIKNPQSLVRLRIASEGLDHSGFIYNDENGEKYFVFPGDDIIYSALSKVTWIFNRETPLVPTPLEFTGKIKFLTPSLDPQSSIPTFSGPLAGVTMLTLRNLMPNYWGIRDRITGVTLGPMSKNATYRDVIIPSNIKRFMDAFLDKNEIDSQWASAARKAAIALEAKGEGLAVDATEEQKLAYQKRIEAIATNTVTVRFFLGLVSPVSPQLGMGKDMPDYLKDLGNVNFKAEFNKLVGELTKQGHPDPYNEAIIRYDMANPGLLAYRIPESDLDKVATVRKTKEAAQWIRNNRELVNKYPEGALFFTPNTGTFDFDDFEFLEQEGYIQYIPVKDFIKSVSVANEKQAYYALVNSWDEKIDNANQYLKPILRKQKSAEVEQFKKDKPLLKQELETRSNRQQIENAYEDLRRMLDSGDAPNNELASKYKEMIQVFDEADGMISMIMFDTTESRMQKEILRKTAYQNLEDIAGQDPQAKAIVRSIFRELLGV